MRHSVSFEARIYLLNGKISALDVVKETGLYSLGMPNRWNISLNYYYTLCLSLPVYVIAFPQLYSHMFRQVSDT